jgi:hypothetical protein
MEEMGDFQLNMARLLIFDKMPGVIRLLCEMNSFQKVTCHYRCIGIRRSYMLRYAMV